MVETQEYKFKTPPNGTGDLFSALFLGHYLASKNAITAVKKSVCLANKVLAILIKPKAENYLLRA